MINEAICQEDISRRRLFLEPVDQRVVPILHLAPASVVNWEEIDDAAGYDEQGGSNGGEFTGQCGSGERNVPQPPKRKRDEEVGDNYPDMNEFLISQNLNRELETKGNCNQTQKCQEKSPLQASRENQRERNQQPLETKGEPEVLSHIRDGRMIYGVAPMKELWHVRSTAPAAQKEHLRQCDQSCCNG